MKTSLRSVLPIILFALCALLIVVGLTDRSGFQVNLPEAGTEFNVPEPTKKAKEEAPPEGEYPEQKEPNKALRVIFVIAGITILLLLLKHAARKAMEYFANRREIEQVTQLSADDSLDQDLAELLIPRVNRALDEGIQALTAYSSPRNAIVEAWRLLEAAVEASGIEKDPSHTPTEFTVNALGVLPLSARDLEIVLKKYHLARFTDKQILDNDVAETKRSLAILRDQLVGVMAEQPQGASDEMV